MEPTTLPVNEGELKKLLLLLENDLAARGWDQPARLYLIRGNPNSPHFELVADLFGHPCDVLQGMWDAGYRVPNDALGIAQAHEGWRHLTLEEVRQRSPRVYGQMLKAAQQLAPEDASDEDITAVIEKAWSSTIQNLPRVSEMPEDMRIEVRGVFAVFRDGTQMGMSRDRDDEPHVHEMQGPEWVSKARVPHFMYQLLNNQRPEES